jgi:hypothetical protein
MIDDIVQGIPKIEQLLRPPMKRMASPSKWCSGAVETPFQTYGAYLPGRSSETKYGRHSRDVGGRDFKGLPFQGVVIADKHLEIIIRQMTSKVAITTPGRSGLFGSTSL